MYNCLVMGSGRSGTSMVIGSLKDSGYFMGNKFIPPREANPKGFFEDTFINHDINEAILAKAFPKLKLGQRWLGVLRKDAQLVETPTVAANIQKMVANEPFCFKDPRISYTLPIWQKYIPKKTKFVCVFRHPAATIQSIMRACKTDKYLRSISMDASRGNRIWNSIYNNIINMKLHYSKILYVHYNQMFSDDGVVRLEKFLKAKVTTTFPDHSLVKPVSADIRVSKQAEQLYKKLCSKAKYTGE